MARRRKIDEVCGALSPRYRLKRSASKYPMLRRLLAQRAEQFLPLWAFQAAGRKEIEPMDLDILFPRCAGIDVHKDTITVCRVYRDQADSRLQDVATFGTMTDDLLAVSDWLAEVGVTHVCMESTGVYWQPIFNILEGNFDVWVVNAHHLKSVPGRKTDKKDARWIAKCFEHGLLNRSFVPPPQQRSLRELTRLRIKLVQQRATLSNRVQKLLEPCNIKLASVATNVLGVSGRLILDALAAGETDAAKMADLAKGKLNAKHDLLVRALNGHMSPTQRFILSELLRQIDFLDESLGRINAEIDRAMVPFREAVALLTSVPGISEQTAEAVIAEIGCDLETFPTADQFCAWSGTAPGSNESAGKRRASRSRHGNVYLKTMSVQIARGAVRTHGSYCGALYHRLVKRRGDGRAILAVAHSIMTSIYFMLKRKVTYDELGADYFAKRKPDAIVRECVRRLKQCGYDAMLQPTEQAVAA